MPYLVTPDLYDGRVCRRGRGDDSWGQALSTIEANTTWAGRNLWVWNSEADPGILDTVRTGILDCRTQAACGLIHGAYTDNTATVSMQSHLTCVIRSMEL